MEPTSEQELKELLDENKISEDEYRQLLEALHQKQKTQQSPFPEDPSIVKSPTGYGKAGLILMIIAIALPVIGIAASLLFVESKDTIHILPAFLFLSLLCGIFAFIFGIIGWKSPAGKIAAIVTPCLVLITPFLVGFFMGIFFFVRAAVDYEPEESSLICCKAYPLDSLDEVITQDHLGIDPVSADGNGSLRIQSDSPQKTIIRLFETGPMNIENCMLIYQAKLKCSDLNGNAYLEMWCDVPGYGESFSRGLDQPVTGTTEWTNAQTPFRLEIGQIPANVKLNLVIEGIGTVWIDDIKLFLGPPSELRNSNSWH